MRNVLFLMSLIATTVSFAGDQYGKIREIVVRSSDNLHYFYLEGESINKPACAVNPYWVIKDENSSAGKTQLSLLLAAYAQQKPIGISGSGTCTRWVDGEDVNVISAKP